VSANALAGSHTARYVANLSPAVPRGFLFGKSPPTRPARLCMRTCLIRPLHSSNYGPAAPGAFFFGRTWPQGLLNFFHLSSRTSGPNTVATLPQPTWSFGESRICRSSFFQPHGFLPGSRGARYSRSAATCAGCQGPDLPAGLQRIRGPSRGRKRRRREGPRPPATCAPWDPESV
jgi:hypothetical protein